MSVLIFKAVIGAVHYDPKKGALKIQLIAASPVSMDKLTTLAPSDEPINIVLESAQAKITDEGVPITLKPGSLEERARSVAEGEWAEDEEEVK